MIQPVASGADPRLADYARVADPTWLRDQGLFVAEGRLVVRRLLESRRFAVRSLLLTPAAVHDFGAALACDAPIYVAEQAILDGITGVKFHRGCLALAQRPTEDRTADRFERAALLLAMEGVGNPDNIGGLFRIAAAFGADGVLLDPASGDPFYRKAVRTSMGAVFALPFVRLGPWPSALERFKLAGFEVVALTPAADARTLDDFAAEDHRSLIVLVGTEGAGLSEGVLRAADATVRIPITAGVDSLNVTVAAGIALSRLTRRSL